MTMRMHLIILGLSLLALVGVIAVSASAAQAEWLLLKNLASVEQLTLAVEGLSGSILIPELGIEIACSGSSGILVAAMENTELTGTGETTFTGCVETEFGGACTVMGPGEEEIKATAQGVVSMKGENIITYMDSGEGYFGSIELSGEECPFTELLVVLIGKVHLVLLEPLADTVVKLSHLDDLELELLPYHALIAGEGESDSLLTHIRSLNGTDTWAIHLVNL